GVVGTAGERPLAGGRPTRRHLRARRQLRHPFEQHRRLRSRRRGTLCRACLQHPGRGTACPSPAIRDRDMSKPSTLWHSPLTAETVAAGARMLAEPWVGEDALYWLAGLPEEGGRATLM